MKSYHRYLKGLKPMPDRVGEKYYAYRNGETKIFDNWQDAEKFSRMYEVIRNDNEDAERQAIIRHNEEIIRLAKEQFNEDLRQESGFNAYQLDICRNFTENYMDCIESDRDEFAELVLALSDFVAGINNAKDQ